MPWIRCVTPVASIESDTVNKCWGNGDIGGVPMTAARSRSPVSPSIPPIMKTVRVEIALLIPLPRKTAVVATELMEEKRVHRRTDS